MMGDFMKWGGGGDTSNGGWWFWNGGGGYHFTDYDIDYVLVSIS